MKEKWWLVLFVCCMITVILIMGGDIVSQTKHNKKCLTPFAETYCQSKDMVLRGVDGGGYWFRCAIDERAVTSERFWFTEKEKEKCGVS